MDENILYNLFTGHINPSGQTIKQTPDYVEIEEDIEKIRKHFFDNFSKEDKRKFWKLNNCYQRLAKLQAYNSFCYAMRFSMQLMIESIKPVYDGTTIRRNVDIDRLREEMDFD